MTPQELRDRSKRFAVNIVRLTQDLPNEWHVRVIGRQLLAEASPSVRSVNYDGLVRESSELTAIFTASHKTARENLRKRAAERVRKREK